MAKKQIKFMCTAFRDGFQSVYGARVLTKDFLPALQAAYDAGIRWFEAGGGARFQSCYFYCNEDAFVSMEKFRATCPEADLQTLSRGVNVVGLESQPSDMIRLHAKLFKKHGISSIRNFDALNDVENLIYSGHCIHDAGLKHEISITMMGLPPGCTGAHDAPFYANVLKRILDAKIPFDRICFKDASGTSTPATIYDTIKTARKMLPESTHIQYHTHETAGTSVIGYKAALEAGADGIDLSLSPVSGGTCQPDVVVMWHALRDTEFDLGIDVDKVRKAEEVFRECMSEYLLPPEALAVDPAIIWSPMPGGALTANTQMMRDNNMLHRYQDLIDAMTEVIRLGGFGTSVTPVSQFYVQQAFNNVIFGPWKQIAAGYGKMVLGYFGKTPVAPDPEIVKLAAEQLQLESTTEPVLSINDADPSRGIKAAAQMLQEAGLPKTDENIFIAGTCKEKGIAFLQGEATLGVYYKPKSKSEPATKAGPCTVTVSNNTFVVDLKDGKAVVNGREYQYEIKEGVQATPNKALTKEEVEVTAPVPGAVLRHIATVGNEVAADEVLMIIEAMKMEIAIKAPSAGILQSLVAAPAQKINTGDVLARITPL